MQHRVSLRPIFRVGHALVKKKVASMVSPIYKKCDNLTFLNLESNSRAFQILSDLPERRCTDIWPSLFTIRIL